MIIKAAVHSSIKKHSLRMTFKLSLRENLDKNIEGGMLRLSSRVLFRRINEFMTSKMELACWNPFFLKLWYFSHSFVKGNLHEIMISSQPEQIVFP